MTALTWDQIGERYYRTGLDRGVLYLQDGTAIAWNGLTGLDESPNRESKSFYLDGIKYLEHQVPSEFVGKLKAITYPDEFEQCMGVASLAPGLRVHDQPGHFFSLTYRVRLGNDVAGSDLGYEIHILYNLLAIQDPIANATMNAGGDSPIEFAWSLTSVPNALSGFRPTTHISFRSTDLDPEVLTALEDALYGTASADPALPSFDDILEILDIHGVLRIIDNGDGTWTAIGDEVTVVAGEFTIEPIDATYLDAGTYEIETTA